MSFGRAVWSGCNHLCVAAPLRKDLEQFLRNHPEYEEFKSRTQRRAEQTAERIAAAQQALASALSQWKVSNDHCTIMSTRAMVIAAKEALAELETKEPRVSIWDKKTKQQLSGFFGKQARCALSEVMVCLQPQPRRIWPSS